MNPKEVASLKLTPPAQVSVLETAVLIWAQKLLDENAATLARTAQRATAKAAIRAVCDDCACLPSGAIDHWYKRWEDSLGLQCSPLWCYAEEQGFDGEAIARELDEKRDFVPGKDKL